MTKGERMKRMRKRLGLSADELAAKIGKDRATIYRYESNDIENMPTSILEPLAKALNTTPSVLMGWEEETNDKATSLITDRETRLLTDFRALDEQGKDYVERAVSSELIRCEKTSTIVTRSIAAKGGHATITGDSQAISNAIDNAFRKKGLKS